MADVVQNWEIWLPWHQADWEVTIVGAWSGHAWVKTSDPLEFELTPDTWVRCLVTPPGPDDNRCVIKALRLGDIVCVAGDVAEHE